MTVQNLGYFFRQLGQIALVALFFAAGPLQPARAADVAVNPPMTGAAAPSQYIIGPGDALKIFVWRNPDLSSDVPVRPDGRISIPLIDDIDCTGKTPTQLAAEIETRLKKFVTDPRVTVIVTSFYGAYEQQVRVVGEAAQPKAIPYKSHMTVLDAMIEVGGLTQFAAGNRATIVRRINGQETTINVHLADLLKDGDVTANMDLRPGDIIIIPQSFF
jgi:polysaccharide export outer membrane protein